jgi:hypothetical protein
LNSEDLDESLVDVGKSLVGDFNEMTVKSVKDN